MVNFYNHKRALQTIANKLSAHIGSGDKAHLPADRQHAGFMTPDQLASLRQSLGERTHLAPKTDIFKLAPGNYWGSDFINSSEPSGSLTILMIDVSQRDDGAKQFVEIESYTGSIKVYTTHTNDAGVNDGAPKSWTSIDRVITLWEGSVSSSGAVFQLTDNFWKFKKLRITTDNLNREKKIVDYIPLGGFVTIGSHNLFDGNPTIFSLCEMRLQFKNASGSIQDNIKTDFEPGRATPVTSGLLQLTKIEGVM